MTAETAARALVDNVFTVFGPPSIILSDRGKNFLGDTIKELCTIYHIKKENTSAFHPQANAISERSHRTVDDHISTLLTRFAKDNQTDWDQYLQIAAYSMRVTDADGTGFSPFFANFGRECRLPIDGIFPPDIDEKETLSEHAIRIKAVLARTQETIRMDVINAQGTTNTNANRNRHPADLKVGDKVMIYNPETIRRRINNRLKMKTSPKILPKWSGPYTIAETFDHQPNVVVVTPQNELGAAKPSKEIINVARVTKFTGWEGPSIPLRWRGKIMRNIDYPPHGQEEQTNDTCNIEAENHETFLMEELVTKLTAIDPLENRLAQINEYIKSMEDQLLIEPASEDHKDLSKAYSKMQEVESEFSKVMRAEDYFEQKLRAQCAQPHERDRDENENREPTTTPKVAQEEAPALTMKPRSSNMETSPFDRSEETMKTGAEIMETTTKTKHSVDTTRTKRKTTTSASSTSNPVTEKSSSNKRRKKIKRERENQQSTTIHKTSTTQQEAKTRQPQIVKEITKERTHNEELGRGKRYKTKTLKQMQNEEDNKLRSALWKAKQKKQ